MYNKQKWSSKWKLGGLLIPGKTIHMLLISMEDHSRKGCRRVGLMQAATWRRRLSCAKSIHVSLVQSESRFVSLPWLGGRRMVYRHQPHAGRCMAFADLKTNLRTLIRWMYGIAGRRSSTKSHCRPAREHCTDGRLVLFMSIRPIHVLTSDGQGKKNYTIRKLSAWSQNWEYNVTTLGLLQQYPNNSQLILSTTTTTTTMGATTGGRGSGPLQNLDWPHNFLHSILINWVWLCNRLHQTG